MDGDKEEPARLESEAEGPSERVRPIHSSKLHQWCIDAGIYGRDDKVSRVVIVMEPRDVARVYVERFGDTRVLRVDPPRVTWEKPDRVVYRSDDPPTWEYCPVHGFPLGEPDSRALRCEACRREAGRGIVETTAMGSSHRTYRAHKPPPEERPRERDARAWVAKWRRVRGTRPSS